MINIKKITILCLCIMPSHLIGMNHPHLTPQQQIILSTWLIAQSQEGIIPPEIPHYPLPEKSPFPPQKQKHTNTQPYVKRNVKRMPIKQPRGK